MNTEVPKNELAFKGEGRSLLGILLLNWLLTALTLGLYYPWARVNRLRFIYSNTTLNETAFVFHGNGKELFKGFVKFFGMVILVYGFYLYSRFIGDLGFTIASLLLLLLFTLLVIPFAIHGAFRYRLSRTSWRSIYFGYRGNRSQLVIDFYIGLLLSVVTFGIYYPWFLQKMRTYIIGNTRFGNLKFGYDGAGSELFIIYLKAYFLIPITFGIYYFWYRKEFINHLVEYTYIEQDGKKLRLKGNITGGSFFALSIINLFLTIFTFGIGIPWTITRTAKFIISSIELPAKLDLSNIAQTEDEYKDATGEDVLDYLDFGIV